MSTTPTPEQMEGTMTQDRPTTPRTMVRADETKHDDLTGYWSSDPDYPVEDWQQEVADGSTRAGYWQWVAWERGSAWEWPDEGAR